VAAGEEIFPEHDKNKDGFLWAHYACAKQAALSLGHSGDSHTSSKGPFSKQVCKHWLKKGSCAFGSGCFFSHHVQPGELNDLVRANSRKYQKMGGAETRRAMKKRVSVKNSGRASALRFFLLNRIDICRLRCGSGVLDVAGGKGELAFQLQHVNGIQTTLFEPRPMLLRKFRRKYAMGIFHKNPVFSKWNLTEKPEKCSEIQTVKHVRIFFDDKLFAWAADDTSLRENWQVWFTEALDHARQTCWTDKGLKTFNGDESSCSESECEYHEQDPEYYRCFNQAVAATRAIDGDGDLVTSAEKCLEILNNASAIVGMHPDQGAEYIVDFALHRNIPFAVVPCCVYSKQFPKRKLLDGTPVKTYFQLLSHLQSKDPRIRRDVLPFEGKNIVLWFDPLSSLTKDDPNIEASPKEFVNTSSRIFEAVRKEVERREGHP
jgi:hypothetical protein